MKDIFDNRIICNECNFEMRPMTIEKSGFFLRAVECNKCGEKIIHPSDLEKYKHYNNLKRKTFSVKLRVVGNSHAISIPKEIVDFINEINQTFRRDVNDVVKLYFEDFGKISLNFIDKENKVKEQRFFEQKKFKKEEVKGIYGQK